MPSPLQGLCALGQSECCGQWEDKTAFNSYIKVIFSPNSMIGSMHDNDDEDVVKILVGH